MNAHSDPQEPAIEGIRTLPELEPPAAMWSAIRTELEQRSRARKARRLGWLGSGLAAALLLGLAIGLIHQVPPSGSTAEPVVLAAAEQQLLQLRQLSALLEAELRQQRHAAISTGSMESLVYLENELGWLDLRLASRPDDLDLWQQRVGLLDEMSRLYGRNHWQAQMQLTSF